MKINKIEKSKNQLRNNVLKRVAAYARVSTTFEEQLGSLKAQIEYYEKLIMGNKEWVFSGIYYDEGITGTSYAHREGFQKMIRDCELGKIDMIITKSISRFARNTLDTIKTVRKLKELNIGVYFEKENIWSLDPKAEFVLTLMAGFAQEEVRSLSVNTAWGLRKRMEAGKYWVTYTRFLGYGPGFEIEEDGANIIRFIFKSTIQGYSRYKVSQLLDEKGVETPGHKQSWHASTINSILQNEKYKGDALCQKSFVEDFLTKKRVKNRGELPKYYVTGGHSAIITPVLFDYVQELLDAEKIMNFRKSGNSIMSSKLICGKCGKLYGRRIIRSNDKYRHVVWECRNKYKKEIRCKNIFFHEKDIPILWNKILSEGLKRNPSSKIIVEMILEKIVKEKDRLIKINAWLRKFPKNSKSIEMDEVAILVEYITVDEQKMEVRMFGGKTFNMTIPLNKRKS